jgi:Na+-translocating ferredoxin:NAD+ oxidoreductase subunit D
MTRVFASPHTRGARPVNRVMGWVILALLPATLAGFYQFGWPALWLWAFTVLACVFFEALCVRMTGREAIPVLRDGSAILTGWLLALSLPPWAPWWIGLVGGAFAIIVCKHAFGGLGQNLFNPAMAARVVLLISFPLEMTTWIEPGAWAAMDALSGLNITLGSVLPDGVTSASLLGHAKTEAARGVGLSDALAGQDSLMTQAMGQRAGSMGETAAVFLLAGGVLLIFKGIIGPSIPAAFLLGVAIPAALFHFWMPETYLSPVTHVLSGAVVLGAFFIATDYVTSPSTPLGQWIFGLGAGFLTWAIRSFGAYPEGVAFAILLMNAATPLIDQYTRPRIFGRERNGQARMPPPIKPVDTEKGA